jgi:hypothetical protein
MGDEQVAGEQRDDDGVASGGKRAISSLDGDEREIRPIAVSLEV